MHAIATSCHKFFWNPVTICAAEGLPGHLMQVQVSTPTAGRPVRRERYILSQVVTYVTLSAGKKLASTRVGPKKVTSCCFSRVK